MAATGVACLRVRIDQAGVAVKLPRLLAVPRHSGVGLFVDLRQSTPHTRGIEVRAINWRAGCCRQDSFGFLNLTTKSNSRCRASRTSGRHSSRHAHRSYLSPSANPAQPLSWPSAWQPSLRRSPGKRAAEILVWMKAWSQASTRDFVRHVLASWVLAQHVYLERRPRIGGRPRARKNNTAGCVSLWKLAGGSSLQHLPRLAPGAHARQA